jgi:mRNA interferase MazF
VTAGDIFWVELPPTNGHEQVGRRPAVVLQDETYAGSSPVVIVVPLTGAVTASRFPGTVLLEPTAANSLRKSSVVLVFQIRAVDRRKVQDRLGAIGAEDLARIHAALDRLMGRVADG